MLASSGISRRAWHLGQTRRLSGPRRRSARRPGRHDVLPARNRSPHPSARCHRPAAGDFIGRGDSRGDHVEAMTRHLNSLNTAIDSLPNRDCSLHRVLAERSRMLPAGDRVAGRFASSTANHAGVGQQRAELVGQGWDVVDLDGSTVSSRKSLLRLSCPGIGFTTTIAAPRAKASEVVRPPGLETTTSAAAMNSSIWSV